MTTWAITGATGLLGSNFLWELFKNHCCELDSLTVILLGRDNDNESLRRRIQVALQIEGKHYAFSGGDEKVMYAALERIMFVDADLCSPQLGVDSHSLEVIRRNGIDYFVHIAALTDFRDTPEVIEDLTSVNVSGTAHAIEFVEAVGGIGEFVFVGSAYCVGHTFGKISPDFEQTTDAFRNPYEKTKLLAEKKVRHYCERRSIPLRVFRPSTIAGRCIENPIGYVTKYDVFYSWCAFFTRLRCKLSRRGRDWKTPIEIPVRIACSDSAGLNIIAADFAAKIMWHTIDINCEYREMHLASDYELSHREYVTLMFNKLNITGWSFVNSIPKKYSNSFEKIYYSTVGAIYTPYVLQLPMNFETDSLRHVCQMVGIDRCNVNLDQFECMIDYARHNYFGISEFV